MKDRNPMSNPETVAKVSNTLKAIGHKPKIQGGNGREPSAAELALLAMFGGLGFVMQPVIRTGSRSQKGGLSTHYKPDMGNWDLKLALEADGGSHQGSLGKMRDAKKTTFLNGIGWTVLRFSNEKILTQPDEVFATVMSTISRLTVSTPT